MDGGGNIKTLLSTVNIFHHFINPESLEVKLPLPVGWLSEPERKWNGDSSGDSCFGPGIFQVF